MSKSTNVFFFTFLILLWYNLSRDSNTHTLTHLHTHARTHTHTQNYRHRNEQSHSYRLNVAYLPKNIFFFYLFLIAIINANGRSPDVNLQSFYHFWWFSCKQLNESAENWIFHWLGLTDVEVARVSSTNRHGSAIYFTTSSQEVKRSFLVQL